MPDPTRPAGLSAALGRLVDRLDGTDIGGILFVAGSMLVWLAIAIGATIHG